MEKFTCKSKQKGNIELWGKKISFKNSWKLSLVGGKKLNLKSGFSETLMGL